MMPRDKKVQGERQFWSLMFIVQLSDNREEEEHYLELFASKLMVCVREEKYEEDVKNFLCKYIFCLQRINSIMRLQCTMHSILQFAFLF